MHDFAILHHTAVNDIVIHYIQLGFHNNKQYMV